jgi:hypothetical protein
VYRVKKIFIWIALMSYLVVPLPVLVVWLSPRPGLEGWIAFGGISFAFGLVSTYALAYALRARVVVEGKDFSYEALWRAKKFDLTETQSVYVSLGSLVFVFNDGRRITIPDSFQNRSQLLEQITIIQKGSQKETLRDS